MVVTKSGKAGSSSERPTPVPAGLTPGPVEPLRWSVVRLWLPVNLIFVSSGRDSSVLTSLPLP